MVYSSVNVSLMGGYSLGYPGRDSSVDPYFVFFVFFTRKKSMQTSWLELPVIAISATSLKYMPYEKVVENLYFSV